MIHKLSDPITNEVSYRVDIQPSRTSKRIRRMFTRLADAKVFELKIKTDFQQSKYLGLQNSSDLPFSELADIYWNRHILVHSKNPGRSEQYRLNKFKRFWKEKSINKITHTDGELYIATHLDRGIKPSTINRDLNMIKSLFKWAIQNKYLTENPIRELRKIKIEDILPRPLSSDEVTHLLNVCNSVGEADLKNTILVALNTGFRKGNLERLTASDVANEFITALRTKSGKSYKVPINKSLRPLLTDLKSRRPHGPLLDTLNLDRRFRRVVKKAGLYKEGNKVTLHCLRDTFATECVKSGIDILTASKWLGHSSVKVTERYYVALGIEHHTQEIKKFAGIS